eukprot:UN34252
MTLENKMKYHTSTLDINTIRGYIPILEQGNYGLDITDMRTSDIIKETLDYKEVFSMGPDLPPEHPDYHSLFYAPNIYPNKTFRAAADAYCNELIILRRNMFSWFALALNLEENHFDKYINNGMDSLNMLRYKPLKEYADLEAPPEDNLAVGIGSHTDFEAFTLLWQQQDRTGLEIP